MVEVLVAMSGCHRVLQLSFFFCKYISIDMVIIDSICEPNNVSAGDKT